MAQEVIQPQEQFDYMGITAQIESLPEQESAEVKLAFDAIVDQIDTMPGEVQEELKGIQASKNTGYGDVMYRAVYVA